MSNFEHIPLNNLHHSLSAFHTPLLKTDSFSSSTVAMIDKQTQRSETARMPTTNDITTSTTHDDASNERPHDNRES
jgi:hypothetical protein